MRLDSNIRVACAWRGIVEKPQTGADAYQDTVVAQYHCPGISSVAYHASPPADRDGNSLHPSQPLRSALLLVSVLSVKMLLENQFFHNVVKCTCEVRADTSNSFTPNHIRAYDSEP